MSEKPINELSMKPQTSTVALDSAFMKPRFIDKIYDDGKAVGWAAKMSGGELAVAEQIKEIIENANLDPKRRRVLLHKIRTENLRKLKKEKRELEIKAAETKAELSWLKRQQRICAEVFPWLKQPLRLQACNESRYGAFIECAQGGKLAIFLGGHAVIKPKEAKLPTAATGEYVNGSIFLIEHDWSRAFANAPDVVQGIVKLPYDECSFELQVSGRRVIVIGKESTEIPPYLAIEAKEGWVFAEGISGDDSAHGWAELLALATGQVKAVCVALDAQVATHEVVRAPSNGNQRGQGPKLPLYDYHVVNLARRERAEPLEGPHEPGTRRRLHFRRGHWRHYAAFKTWVRWCLVGDPNLGFIDKEYRL